MEIQEATQQVDKEVVVLASWSEKHDWQRPTERKNFERFLGEVYHAHAAFLTFLQEAESRREVSCVHPIQIQSNPIKSIPINPIKSIPIQSIPFQSKSNSIQFNPIKSNPNQIKIKIRWANESIIVNIATSKWYVCLWQCWFFYLDWIGLDLDWIELD